MRILIVEDDPTTLDYIKKALLQHNHNVDGTDNGRDGLFLASTEKYDAIIVDRMLPSLDGLTLIKTLRGAGNQTPVLILSALGLVDDRVKGLRSGGDDYLVKPFAFAELLARIELLAKRQPVTAEDSILTVLDLHMDLLKRKVTRGGKPIDLQSREFVLLEYMLRHKGQVLTRTMLLENVWDYSFDPQTNVIDVHISRLRGKVDKGHAIALIKTVRGAGYKIDEQD